MKERMITLKRDLLARVINLEEGSDVERVLMELAQDNDLEHKKVAALLGTNKVLDLLKNEDKVHYYVAEQIALRGRDSDLQFIIDYKAPQITAAYAEVCNDCLLKNLIHIKDEDVRIAIIKRNETKSIEKMLSLSRGKVLFRVGEDHLSAYEFAKLGHEEFLSVFKTHPRDASAAGIFTKEKRTLEFLAKEDIWCSNLAKDLLEEGDYIDKI